VLLRKPRAYAEIFNDLNSEVVNLFKVARDNEANLRRLVELTPYSREEWNLSHEPVDNALEKARRFLVRSHMSHGSSGVCSRSRSGFRGSAVRKGSCPSHDWIRYPEALSLISERLQGVIVENKNAIELVKYHDSTQTLIYADPPYVHSTRTWFTAQYKSAYSHEMCDSDHVVLADVLKSVKGFVVLSGYESELYAELYKGWLKVKKDVKADKSVDRTECLWLNEACVAALGGSLLTLFEVAS
jgi:DNA adenine methylase